MSSVVEFDAPETLDSVAVMTSEIEEHEDRAEKSPVVEVKIEAGSEQVIESIATALDADLLVLPDGPQPAAVQHTPMVDSEKANGDIQEEEEIDLLDEILDASMECRKLEAVVELRKEEVKEAKSQLEQAVIRLRNVCSEIGTVRGMVRRRAKTNAQPMQEVGQVVDQAVAAGPPSTVNADHDPDASENHNESWRSVSMAVILEEKIKGFGAKKKEALIDLCPTLGDFEDLRKRVGKDAAELHELLPDGIGLETASVIEERHLEWIAKNCQGVSVQSEAASITERASQIGTGSNSCLDARHPEGRNWYESGWTAYGKECPLEECPYIPGPEQDDWIRGWLSHQFADRIPDSHEVTEQSPNEIQEADQVLANPVSLDDL